MDLAVFSPLVWNLNAKGGSTPALLNCDRVAPGTELYTQSVKNWETGYRDLSAQAAASTEATITPSDERDIMVDSGAAALP